MTQGIIGFYGNARAMGCVFLFLALLLGAGVSAQGATTPDVPAGILAKCQADLAQRLKLTVKEITVRETQATTWSDTALGMPEIGKMYAQVLTPGWRILLGAHGGGYLYTASAKAFRYGGPLSLWGCSTLFITPNMHDANLNGDLYQCSLLGTNPVLLLSGVTSYSPQEKGAVIATRRTSRSGHELLLVKTAAPGQATALYGAFDFGDAALNSAQDTWAAFVRPMVGASWAVVVARIGQDQADAITLPLPAGVQTGRIAWLGEKVMILQQNGEAMTGYATAPFAPTPTWTATPAYEFPGLTSYSLNKSEMLEITQRMQDGKPSVEVAGVWFTGDRRIIATINGLTLRSDDLFGLRYAFIQGEIDGNAAVYTVDIATGEVIPGLHGNYQTIKPFNEPSISHPLEKQ